VDDCIALGLGRYVLGYRLGEPLLQYGRVWD